MSQQTVLVSGANGYLAQHLVKLLLNANYKVVGTVRSEAKGEALKALFKSYPLEYVVVPDIVKAGAFDEAFEKYPETVVFFHAASPFHFSTNEVEKDLLIPAVEGTKNALASAKAHGKNVKKFILTSSYASIGFSMLVHGPNPTRTVNEETWTEMTWAEASTNPVFGYLGSKTLAEREAWKFLEAEKPQFTLSCVNPPYLFGPQAFDSEVKADLNTSSEFINAYLKLTPSDPLPTTVGWFFDVRDVARAHVAAFEDDAFVGQRLLTMGSPFVPQTIANIIHKNFPELKDTVPVGTPSEGNNFEGTMDGKLDDSKTKKALGFEYITLEQSVVDSVTQILAARK